MCAEMRTRENTNKKHLEKLSYYKTQGSIFEANNIENQITKSLKL